MALSPKQQRFVDEYLIDLNATQAAIRAGYSERTANPQAARLLANVSVREAIESAQMNRSCRTKIDADYVLNRLVEIDQMDVLDILDDDGNIKPLKEWPKIWRQYLSAMDIVELSSEDGSAAISRLKKIKWPEKTRNLELLGKHVSVQAFKDRVEHSGSIGTRELTDDELERIAAGGSLGAAGATKG